nr:unnamed protein product [Callosobruchus analis]
MQTQSSQPASTLQLDFRDLWVQNTFSKRLMLKCSRCVLELHRLDITTGILKDCPSFQI